MKESSLERLEALKIATLKEEQEYNDLLAVEKLQLQYQEHLKMANSSHNKLEAMLDEVLEEVAVAADKLESGILEHAFDQSKKVTLFYSFVFIFFSFLLVNYNFAYTIYYTNYNIRNKAWIRLNVRRGALYGWLLGQQCLAHSLMVGQAHTL